MNTARADDFNLTSSKGQDPLPNWDGTPIAASLFLRNVGDYAAQHGFYSLLLKDYFVSRGVIFTANADATGRIRAHFNDPAANPLPDNIQDPPIPVPTTAECTYVPTTEDRRLYNTSPLIFASEASRRNEEILSAIIDPDVRRRLRRDAGGDARMLIRCIADVRN